MVCAVPPAFVKWSNHQRRRQPPQDSPESEEMRQALPFVCGGRCKKQRLLKLLLNGAIEINAESLSIKGAHLESDTREDVNLGERQRC